MCAFYVYAEWKILARPQMETSRVRRNVTLGSLSESDSLEHVVHLEQRAHVLLRKLSSRRGQTVGERPGVQEGERAPKVVRSGAHGRVVMRGDDPIEPQSVGGETTVSPSSFSVVVSRKPQSAHTSSRNRLVGPLPLVEDQCS